MSVLVDHPSITEVLSASFPNRRARPFPTADSHAQPCPSSTIERRRTECPLSPALGREDCPVPVASPSEL